MQKFCVLIKTNKHINKTYYGFNVEKNLIIANYNKSFKNSFTKIWNKTNICINEFSWYINIYMFPWTVFSFYTRNIDMGWQPRSLRRVSLLILSDLLLLAEVRWLCDIRLWKGESQIVWILHVHVGQYWPKMLNVCIPAQCTLSEAPSQAAGYPPHPSPQSG